jgi:hypothetical protein
MNEYAGGKMHTEICGRICVARRGKWAISSEHRRRPLMMMMTLAPSKIGFILFPNSCPKNDQSNYFFDTLSEQK